jgi:hypothetical protein
MLTLIDRLWETGPIEIRDDRNYDDRHTKVNRDPNASIREMTSLISG